MALGSHLQFGSAHLIEPHANIPLPTLFQNAEHAVRVVERARPLGPHDFAAYKHHWTEHVYAQFLWRHGGAGGEPPEWTEDYKHVSVATHVDAFFPLTWRIEWQETLDQVSHLRWRRRDSAM
jgi:hypothetical protein